MSESLQDSLEHDEFETKFNSIGVLTFFSKNFNLLTVIRKLKKGKKTLKFSVSCRCDHAYMLFNMFIDGTLQSFDSTRLEHNQLSNEIDLTNHKIESILIHSVDNNEQTCICDIKLRTTIKSVL